MPTRFLATPLVATALLTVMGCAPMGPPAEPIRMNPDGVAIDRYSPVSYLPDGAAAKGDPKYAAEHAGATYWLRSPTERERFVANPGRFVPAHGGWCTLMMGGSGRRTPGHPESFAIVDDRLMLFWSGDKEANQGMGLANCVQKTGGDIAAERSWIDDVDTAWQAYVAGQRKSALMLYKPSDATTITPAQRASAKEAFIE